MNLGYLIKEARYYNKLGKGHFKRMLTKFLLAKTPLSKVVNTPFYSKFYAMKMKNRIKNGPSVLQIENTNLCNAKCIMCPHVKMKRKQKIMTQKEFVKICRNVLPYEKIRTLTITGFGEPLIDREIFEKIEWINKNYPKIDIDIYTNASLLTKEYADKLLELKTHKINFSINGTEETYSKIMKLNYENTRQNILYFLRRKKELGKTYPLTNISLMILNENRKDIEKIINFWIDKANSVMSYAPSNWAGGLKELEIITKTPFRQKRWPCFALWNNITVDVEGNVVMCCRDYESRVKFGNLLRQNIKNIRNSEKFRNLMKKQLNFDFSTEICNKCDNSFDSSLDWWG